MEYPTSNQERELTGTRCEYWLSNTSIEPSLAQLKPLREYDEVNCHSTLQAELVAGWYNANGFRARQIGSRVLVVVTVN